MRQLIALVKRVCRRLAQPEAGRFLRSTLIGSQGQYAFPMISWASWRLNFRRDGVTDPWMEKYERKQKRYWKKVYREYREAQQAAQSENVVAIGGRKRKRA